MCKKGRPKGMFSAIGLPKRGASKTKPNFFNQLTIAEKERRK